MKNLVFFCVVLVCFGFESCKKTNEIDASKLQAEKPISTQCYQALFEKDTINLELNTLKNGKITGNMVMIFENMPKKNGEIVGEFHGDTLFVSYTFVQGANDKHYKNPMAFLKQGNGLILGNGKITHAMGAYYIDKATPIDFERVKYKFTNVDCDVKK